MPGAIWAGVSRLSGDEYHRTGDVVVAIQLNDVTPARLQVAWAELDRCKSAWKARQAEPGPLADAAAESRKWERLYEEGKEERDRLLDVKLELNRSVHSLRDEISSCERSLSRSFWMAVSIVVSIAGLLIAICCGLANKPFGALLGFILFCVGLLTPLWFWSRRDSMRERLVGLDDELTHAESQMAAVEVELGHAEEKLATIGRKTVSAQNSYYNLARLDPVGLAHENARREYEEVQKILESAQWQLLHTDWRSLRGVDFENFLQRVFKVLGYNVQTTKATGDQGIDLILTAPGKRIGIQAKGYSGSIGNDAVQQAFTGRAYYRCESCAVITNSSFTAAAREAASQVGCALVDGYRLPELIKGTIRL
jgi:restriction endonuclease